jgi:hypothetical protein
MAFTAPSPIQYRSAASPTADYQARKGMKRQMYDVELATYDDHVKCKTLYTIECCLSL